MFKRLIVGTFICLVGGLYAQTDQLNAKKYWKFRNNFRRDFVKIGAVDQEINLTMVNPMSKNKIAFKI
jgi:hypothetical protein